MDRLAGPAYTLQTLLASAASPWAQAIRSRLRGRLRAHLPRGSTRHAESPNTGTHAVPDREAWRSRLQRRPPHGRHIGTASSSHDAIPSGCPALWALRRLTHATPTLVPLVVQLSASFLYEASPRVIAVAGFVIWHLQIDSSQSVYSCARCSLHRLPSAMRDDGVLLLIVRGWLLTLGAAGLAASGALFAKKANTSQKGSRLSIWISAEVCLGWWCLSVCGYWLLACVLSGC